MGYFWYYQMQMVDQFDQCFKSENEPEKSQLESNSKDLSNDLINIARPYLNILSQGLWHQGTRSNLNGPAPTGIESISLVVTTGKVSSRIIPVCPQIGDHLQNDVCLPRGFDRLHSDCLKIYDPAVEQFVPIRDFDGNIIAGLSIHWLNQRVNDQLLPLFLAVGQGIEAELTFLRLERRIKSALKDAVYKKLFLEKLMQDILQLSTIGKIGIELAAKQFFLECFDAAAKSLNSAVNSIDSFREKSSLCLLLIAEETNADIEVSMKSIVKKMFDLLSTEVRIRNVTISDVGYHDFLVPINEPILRNLFKHIVDGISLSEGRTLEVRVTKYQQCCAIDLTSKSDFPVFRSLKLAMSGVLKRLSELV